MKKLSKVKRRKAYLKFLNILLQNPTGLNFFCNHVRDTYKLQNSSSDLCGRLFPEYFLFQESDKCSWLNFQTELSYVQGDVSFELNEYRVFITQLCIEMTK